VSQTTADRADSYFTRAQKRFAPGAADQVRRPGKTWVTSIPRSARCDRGQRWPRVRWAYPRAAQPRYSYLYTTGRRGTS
jgi:hypothetical protein